MDKNLIVCKKCESRAVNRVPVKSSLFVTGGCLLWIPIIGWIAGALLILWALLLTILPFGGVPMKCENCKYVFRVKRKTYKKYMKYLKGNGKGR